MNLKINTDSVKLLFKFIKFKKTYLISFALALAIFGWLQYQSWGVFSDPDGFYHAKVSQLLIHGDLTDRFIWMPFTTWATQFADQHYLYHLLLAPSSTENLLPLSIILFGLVFFATFLTLMFRLKARGIIWWSVLLLLGSVDFIFRINLVKANTLSLALMLGMLILLISWQDKRSVLKSALIALVSFVFVWTYGGFVFLPALVGGYLFSILVLKKRLDYLPFLAMLLGVTAGMFFHPHSSHLLQSLSNQLFQTGLGAGSEVPAGNEWLAYNLDWFIKSNLILLIIWASALLLTIKKLINKTLQWEELWLQLLALFFLILAVLHRRFIEYYVPFAVIASAVTITPYFLRVKWTDVKESFSKYWQFKFVVTFVVLSIIFAFQWNFGQSASFLNDGTGVNHYKEAAEVIANSSNQGDIVLNTQWDQFPQLWYWNSKNFYIAGMDPTFLYLQEPERYWQWRKIADDNPEDWTDVEQTYRLIKDDLDTKFVFVEIDRNPDIDLWMNANSQYFENIYSTNELSVFKVK